MAVDVQLVSDKLAARVSPVGAELVGLSHRDHGQLLWQGDPIWWTRSSPVLFPVVGRCASDRIRIGTDSYPMPLHGFAHSNEFAVVESGPDRCVLRLGDSPATRLHYPFAFELDIAYRLGDENLSVEAIVRNPGGSVLPFSFGFHPGLRWPLSKDVAKEAHVLVFDADDRLDVCRARDGFLLPGSSALELRDGVLPLSERLFDQGAMVLMAPRSRRIRFAAAEAPYAIDVGFRNLPSLGLWMKPGAGFLCIEPWAGHADPAGFAGDIFDKPGILAVAPGADASFAMDIAVISGT
jgi:galactose mutarotase-like enzyme